MILLLPEQPDGCISALVWLHGYSISIENFIKCFYRNLKSILVSGGKITERIYQYLILMKNQDLTGEQPVRVIRYGKNKKNIARKSRLKIKHSEHYIVHVGA